MPLPSTTEPVAPLVGTMPPACEQDIRALRRFVRSRVSEEVLAPAVAPPAFNEVFVTGATGFVGRFLLRDLLRQDESRVVHCLVRAADADHGLERVRDAMRQAGIWDEGFEPRLRVWTGDLVQPRFGLDSSDFNRLCERIDAVYHVAADVALIAPYVNVRETIITSLRQVLDLCLSVRFKHLFFTSTLGLFPQYFCGFAREFQDSRIETQMQPDLDSMKRLFPLGLVGYPWGKLTAEQILLHAQRSGCPLPSSDCPRRPHPQPGFQGGRPQDAIVCRHGGRWGQAARFGVRVAYRTGRCAQQTGCRHLPKPPTEIHHLPLLQSGTELRCRPRGIRLLSE